MLTANHGREGRLVAFNIRASRCSLVLVTILSFAACGSVEPPTEGDLAILSIVAADISARMDIPYESHTGVVLIRQETIALTHPRNRRDFFSPAETIEELVDTQTLQDLFIRNMSASLLRGFKATNHYRLVNESDIELGKRGQLEYVKLGIGMSLPGYSLMRRKAIVRVNISSRHPSWATYVLVKHWGSWKIQAASIVFDGHLIGSQPEE